MPMRGRHGRSPPSEPSGSSEALGRKRPGGWKEEAGEGGAGRIPVLKTLLRSEANKEIRYFCRKMLFIPVLVSMRTLFM